MRLPVPTACRGLIDLVTMFKARELHPVPVGHIPLVWKGSGSGIWATCIDGALIPLLKDYLSDRHLKVTVSGWESDVQPIEAGIPQGSCLGPLFLNIYINDLLHLISSPKTYADITLAQSYDQKKERTTVSQLNTWLSRIVAWGNIMANNVCRTKHSCSSSHGQVQPCA